MSLKDYRPAGSLILEFAIINWFLTFLFQPTNFIFVENLNNICSVAIFNFLTLYLYKIDETFAYLHDLVILSIRTASLTTQ